MRIGDGNVFREHVTVHRSVNAREATVIGNGCLLMASCHVGHNTALGNHVILANGALLAGYVIVGDRAFLSGNCMVHQFTRVGELAMMQGGAGISKDLPPFTIARGTTDLWLERRRVAPGGSQLVRTFGAEALVSLSVSRQATVARSHRSGARPILE